MKTDSSYSCEWCEDERVVFLGTGAVTEFFTCPACIGLAKAELYGVYLEDAEYLAKTYGLPIKWIV